MNSPLRVEFTPDPFQVEPNPKEETDFPAIDALVDAIPEDQIEAQRRKLKTGFKLYQVANTGETQGWHVCV